MVAIPIESQRLSARDDGGGQGQGNWGPMQIAAPAIVGGVLLLSFAAYIFWLRRPVRNSKHTYDYHQVQTDWVAKIESMLVPRRMRRRVLRSSAPTTLDDSMRMPRADPLDLRRSRQYRSDSSNSQTPLTSTSYAFDYPPNHKLSDSPPPIPKRRVLRWWWLFGSRPKEIKSQEPGSRWRIDDPDGSSTGHGHSNHGHDYHPRYVGGLETMHEVPEEADGGVIQIGENFTSIASTLTTQHAPEQVRPLRGMSTVPEHHESSASVARTPPPAENALLQSNSGAPVSSANRGLPPSYDISQSHMLVGYPSAEEIALLPRSEPYMPVIIPPRSRTAGYSPSPRGFHGRELSSDSFLATQHPMTVATSLY